MSSSSVMAAVNRTIEQGDYINPYHIITIPVRFCCPYFIGNEK